MSAAIVFRSTPDSIRQCSIRLCLLVAWSLLVTASDFVQAQDLTQVRSFAATETQDLTDDTNVNASAAQASEVVHAAEAFIDSLDEKQRERLVFDFDDQKQRRNWSNLPEGIVRRGGLRWEELSNLQRQALKKMLQATMSQSGYQQIIDNMHGDEILHRNVVARGGNNQPDFGEDAYYVSFLGKPSLQQAWMWQFGGHHLAINATVDGSQITLSPSLTGGQPMRYQWEGKEVVQMEDEVKQAYQMVNGLTDQQQEVAIVASEPANMIYGPGNEKAKPKQEGIAAKQLTDEQKKQLLQLIELRIGILNPVHAKVEMQKARDNLDETWFAWFGSTEPGEAASYRIQGPTVLIEFSPQALGGDLTQHTHAMYRDPSNDYGMGAVKEN